MDHVFLIFEIMEEKGVVIKLGGGLITRKGNLCEPDLHTINEMVNAISVCWDNGVNNIILIHGAGSFGAFFQLFIPINPKRLF